jgi:hypothetical protein
MFNLIFEGAMRGSGNYSIKVRKLLLRCTKWERWGVVIGRTPTLLYRMQKKWLLGFTRFVGE